MPKPQKDYSIVRFWGTKEQKKVLRKHAEGYKNKLNAYTQAKKIQAINIQKRFYYARNLEFTQRLSEQIEILNKLIRIHIKLHNDNARSIETMEKLYKRLKRFYSLAGMDIEVVNNKLANLVGKEKYEAHTEIRKLFKISGIKTIDIDDPKYVYKVKNKPVKSRVLEKNQREKLAKVQAFLKEIGNII